MARFLTGTHDMCLHLEPFPAVSEGLVQQMKGLQVDSWGLFIGTMKAEMEPLH